MLTLHHQSLTPPHGPSTPPLRHLTSLIALQCFWVDLYIFSSFFNSFPSPLTLLRCNLTPPHRPLPASDRPLTPFHHHLPPLHRPLTLYQHHLPPLHQRFSASPSTFSTFSWPFNAFPSHFDFPPS